MPPIRFHEGHRLRATGEGLQTNRPASGEKVKEIRTRDFELDDIEEGLANTILRRTNRIRLRNL